MNHSQIQKEHCFEQGQVYNVYFFFVFIHVGVVLQAGKIQLFSFESCRFVRISLRVTFSIMTMLSTIIRNRVFSNSTMPSIQAILRIERILIETSKVILTTHI